MATATRKEIPSSPPAPLTEMARQFIPTDTTEIVGMELETAAIEVTMAEKIPTILTGHTGTAKTLLLEHLHMEKEWPYRGVTAHGQVEVDTFLGKWVVGKDGMEYKLGILPFCMKYGIALGVQEVNAVLPEVLMLLHEYVDQGYITLMDLDPEHPDFKIVPHENFRLYGTMNPPSDYPGTRDLSPALVRRCLIRTVDPLTKEQDIMVVRQQCPWVSQEDALQMAGVAQAVRQQFDTGQSFFWLSTADLVTWGTVMQYVDPIPAGQIAVVGKAPKSEQRFVKAQVRMAFDPNADTDSEDEPF